MKILDKIATEMLMIQQHKNNLYSSWTFYASSDVNRRQ